MAVKLSNIFSKVQWALVAFVFIATVLVGYITFFTSNNSYKKTSVIYFNGKKDYTKIFQDVVSNSNHVIIKSGTYYLAKPIYLNDNITIEGEGTVKLMKVSNYSHVFVNTKTKLDFAEKFNINIIIANILIDANNEGSQIDAAHKTANGIISFKFLNNLILNNVKIINGDSQLYGVHLQSVKNAIVKSYFYDGAKDGFHINGGCENIMIDGFEISSFDDAFGIMTDDYPRVQHNTKDIKNIIIKNGVSKKRKEQTGFFIRFMTSSWLEWQNKNKYNIGNIVNVNNLQYKKVNPGEMVSTLRPNHELGDSLYLDGIFWRFLGKGNNKSSNIFNISVSNVNLEDNRIILRTVNKDSFNYGEYPGTENTSIVDGLFIDNIKFLSVRGKMGNYKISKSSKNYIFLLFGILTALLSFIILVFIRFVQLQKKVK